MGRAESRGMVTARALERNGEFRRDPTGSADNPPLPFGAHHGVPGLKRDFGPFSLFSPLCCRTAAAGVGYRVCLAECRIHRGGRRGNMSLPKASWSIKVVLLPTDATSLLRA